MNARYEGKPLLRILECYVLDAIGELEPADEAKLAQIAPKLGAAYGARGSWREVVEQIMDFSPQVAPEFRKLWEHNQQLAAEHRQQLLPEDFARMVVDQNFAELT